MERYTERVNYRNHITIHHDLNATDKRGRNIGCQIATWEEDLVLRPEGAMGGYHIEPGHYFCLRVWTTRNGETYGPGQPHQHFTTTEAREAAIAKYLTYATKRATRLGKE